MTDSYKTGYRRPPLKSRFQPGKSGNPKGRPKKEKVKANLTATMDEVLKEVVTVKENGRSIKMPKIELIVRNYVQKAMAGDLRALGILVKLAKQSEVLVDPPREELPAVLVVPEVAKSIEEWEENVRRRKEEMEKKLRAAEFDKSKQN